MAAILPADSSAGADRSEPRTSPMKPQPQRRRVAPWADALFAALRQGGAWLTLALMVGIIGSLILGATPALKAFGLGFLTSAMNELASVP